MGKLWLVARQEYGGRVRQRSFLVGTLSILAIIAVIMGITAIIVMSGRDDRPLGYVDGAGVFGAKAVSATEGPELRAFADEAAAREALGAGVIQAFYILPEDYLSRREVALVYGKEPPGEQVRGAFDKALRVALAQRALAAHAPAAGAPAGVQQRLIGGTQVTLRSLDGRRQIDPASIVDALLPFLAGFLFVLATVSSSGYLLQALTAEKENRTSEVMITTLTPLQLVGGKSLGLMAVSLTQLAVWLAVALAAIAVGGLYFPELSGLHVSPGLIGVILLYFLPAFALIAGMMTAISAIMPDQQQGQQVAGLLNMMFFVPYFLAAIFFTNPNGPLAVALTLFPTTAFTAITVRWGMTTIPTWQLAASWVILVISAIFCVVFAAQIFRVGMLTYGQRLDARSIRAALGGRGS
jgi:ABC-2 type transport system permease protein